MYTVNCNENSKNFIINNDDETMADHQGIMDKEVIIKIMGAEGQVKEVRLHHVKNIVLKKNKIRFEWREAITETRSQYNIKTKPKVEVKYYSVRFDYIVEMEIW